MLPEFVCVMCVRDQSCQSCVACLSPFNLAYLLFVSKLRTILQLIRALSALFDGHPSRDLNLCCSPVHNIAQSNLEQVPPCRGTKLLFLREGFPKPFVSVA